MNIKYYVIFSLIVLSGCGSRKNQRSHGQQPVAKQEHTKKVIRVPKKKPSKVKGEQRKQKPKKEYKRIYVLLVQGMECPVCKEAIEYRLQRIDGVTQVTCASQDNDMLHALHVAWDKKENIPLGRVVRAIEREDFILQQLSGVLKGVFGTQNGKRIFTLEGTGEPFRVSVAVGKNAQINDATWAKIKKDKALAVRAVLWRDPDRGVYTFSLS